MTERDEMRLLADRLRWIREQPVISLYLASEVCNEHLTKIIHFLDARAAAPAPGVRKALKSDDCLICGKPLSNHGHNGGCNMYVGPDDPTAKAANDALYAAYLGISVLSTMCKRAGLKLAKQRAEELLIELDTTFPGLAARAALREIPPRAALPSEEGK